jgi:glycosyltransferase involved in cell wall biosynthesis
MNLNIIFMPISIIEGMAGTKRLKNFAVNLKTKPTIKINNIVITNGITDKLKQDNLKLNNYKQIKFNYKNPINWITFPIQIIYYLFIFKNTNCKNIIYNYGYPNIQNIFYLLFAKLIGYKLVFDIVEDNESVTSFPSSFSKIKTNTSIFLIKKLNMFCDGAIGISSHLMIKLNSYIPNASKTIHLPISVDLDDYVRPSILNKDFIKIFYGGSFGTKDGVKYLLEAFDHLADKYINIKLFLTGTSAIRYIEVFEKDLAKIKNKDRIVLLGYLNEEEYFHHLCSSDILCMTRINSPFSNAGFPFKLGEMLATGKPVIATNVGDVASYLNENNALLIQPESVNILILSIEMLINDKVLSDQIGINGRILAEKNFNAKILSEKLYKFLLEI